MELKRWLSIVGVLTVAVVAAIFFAACGGDGDNGSGGGTVVVTLDEFTVSSDKETIGAGTVTFEVTNDGEVSHNLNVIKTDLDAGDLPVADSIVDEALVDVVDKTDDIDTGSSASVSVELEAGSYVLICNVPTHYEAGMTVAFTVE